MREFLLSIFTIFFLSFTCPKDEVRALKLRILKNAREINEMSEMPSDNEWIVLERKVNKLDKDFVKFLSCANSDVKGLLKKDNEDLFNYAYSADGLVLCVNFWEPSFGSRGGISHTFIRWKMNDSTFICKKFQTYDGATFSIWEIHKLKDSLYLLIGGEQGNSTTSIQYAVPVKFKNDQINLALDLFPYMYKPQYDMGGGGALKLKRDGLECESCTVDYNSNTKSFSFENLVGPCQMPESKENGIYDTDVEIKFKNTKFILIEKNKRGECY